jgi:hypothetical protein
MAEEPSPLDLLRNYADKISTIVVESCDVLLQEAGRRLNDPSIRFARERLKEFSTSLGELAPVGDGARETFTKRVECLEGKLRKIQDLSRQLKDFGLSPEVLKPFSGSSPEVIRQIIVLALEEQLQEARAQFVLTRWQKLQASFNEFKVAVSQELNRQSKQPRIDAAGDHYCKLLWRLRHELLLLPEGSGIIVATFYRAMAMLLQSFIAMLAVTDASLVKKRPAEDYAVYRGLFVAVNPDVHQAWLALHNFFTILDCLDVSAFLGNSTNFFAWLGNFWKELSRHYAIYRLFEVFAHMRAWGSPEYEHMPEADRDSFRAIVAGRELFNYVEDCKRELGRTGVNVPDEWVQVFYAEHLDVGSPLPHVERDHLGQILDAMYPMLSSFDPYAIATAPRPPTFAWTFEEAFSNTVSALPSPAAGKGQDQGNGGADNADNVLPIGPATGGSQVASDNSGKPEPVDEANSANASDTHDPLTDSAGGAVCQYSVRSDSQAGTMRTPPFSPESALGRLRPETIAKLLTIARESGVSKPLTLSEVCSKRIPESTDGGDTSKPFALGEACSKFIAELTREGEPPEQLAKRLSDPGTPAEQHLVEQSFFVLGLVEDVVELERPYAPPKLMLEADAQMQHSREFCEALRRAVGPPNPSEKLVQVAASLQSPEREHVLACEWLIRAAPLIEMLLSSPKGMDADVAKLWNAFATPVEALEMISRLRAEHGRLTKEGLSDQRRRMMVLWLAAVSLWRNMDPLPPMPAYAGRDIYITAYELGLLSDPSGRYVLKLGTFLQLSNDLLGGLGELTRFIEASRVSIAPTANIKPTKSIPTGDSDAVPNGASSWIKREGGYYKVNYDGELGTIPAQLAGATYVFELLQHPYTFYKATVLRGAIESADSGKADQAESQEALAKCNRELKQIDADIAEADRDRNETEKAELVEKREEILSEVKRLSGGLGGKTRRRKQSESARVSVTKSIELVIQKCRDDFGLPRFATHLDKAIEKGTECAYRPAAPAPHWDF